jgi:hypothetical protein
MAKSVPGNAERKILKNPMLGFCRNFCLAIIGFDKINQLARSSVNVDKRVMM